MKYNRFEDLPVWQAAIDFSVAVYALTATPDFKNHYSLRDQLERASVSISNNIAEGFERGTTPELLTFLYIARGSSGECRSMLGLFEKIPHFDNLKPQVANLKTQAEIISRQLRGWADALQNSAIKGQRYLTDRTRKTAKAERQREEFLTELRKEHEARMAAIQKTRNQPQNG